MLTTIKVAQVAIVSSGTPNEWRYENRAGEMLEEIAQRRLILSLLIIGWLLIAFIPFNLAHTSLANLYDGLALLPIVLVPLVGKYVELGGQEWRTGWRENMSGSDFLFITAFLAARGQYDLSYRYEVEWESLKGFWWPAFVALMSAVSGAIWIRSKTLGRRWSLVWGGWCGLLCAVIGASAWMAINKTHATIGRTEIVGLIEKRVVKEGGRYGNAPHPKVSVIPPSASGKIEWIRVSETSWSNMQPGDKVMLSYMSGGLGLDWWEYTGWEPTQQRSQARRP